MPEQKKDRSANKDLTKKVQQQKGAPPAGTHSQDADRHRKTRHPISDK